MAIRSLISTALIGAITLTGASAITAAPKYGKNRDTSTSVSSTSTISADEYADLQFMREEEKLARDVYLTLDEYWGTRRPASSPISLYRKNNTPQRLISCSTSTMSKTR